MPKTLEFPISGQEFCEFFLEKLTLHQDWILRDIETLASAPTPELGELWSRVQVEPIKLSTIELMGALRTANQIVSLDITQDSDKGPEILIEDGKLSPRA